ncbi:MAG: hypothetical protein IJ007_10220 [Oscillospiraceae bacterium]|nr:hypothetical protein [Oscillospiraceae bacterium]
MSVILDKFFSKDKFDSELKNILKANNLSINGKKSDKLYIFTDGSASCTADISRAKRDYIKNSSLEKTEKLVLHIKDEIAMERRMASFTNAQDFLRFIAVRKENVTKNMIYAEFADGICKVMVCTSDNITLHYLNEGFLKKWAVPKEVLFSAADRNMCRIFSKAAITPVPICDGVKAAELELSCKHFTASAMMCNDFRRALSKQLGEKFFVIVPADDTLIAFDNLTDELIRSMGKAVISKFKSADHPLSCDLLLFTKDDVKIAGSFSEKKKDE